MRELTLIILSALFLPERTCAEEWSKLKPQAESACVRVGDKGETRIGTGAVIGVKGSHWYILTAAHLVRKQKELAVHLRVGDKAERLGDVEVLLESAAHDLALVRVVAGERTARILRIGERNDDAARTDFEAMSVGLDETGFPLGRVEQVSGRKLLERANGTRVFAWESNDLPPIGRSGGPLMDADGRVIGICSGMQEGKGYYIHRDEIRAWLKKRGYDWLLRSEPEKQK